VSDSISIQFADGVADVAILGPIARIEFFVLRPVGQPRQQGEQPELQRVPSFTVAMPVDALANAVTMLEGVRNRLVEAGVLRQGTQTPGTDTVRHRSGSPNFNLKS
jgi:hypothetical protein